LRYKIVTMLFLLTATSAILQPIHAQNFDRRIIGFYTSWSTGDRNFHVQNIPVDSVTHIYYAFAKIEDGEIALGDEYADIDRFYEGDSWNRDSLRGCFHQLQILKAERPHLKTIIVIGGDIHSIYFSDVALTPESRRVFSVSCSEFVEKYDFDGIDIDWEYPVEGGHEDNQQREEDGENLTLLASALRLQLDMLSLRTGRDYHLSISASGNVLYAENIEVSHLMRYLDWINVMTYDFHGPWGGVADNVTNFNSPLYRAEDDPLDEPYHSSFNMQSAIFYYLDQGVPPDRLNVGFAFYGRGYGNVEESEFGMFVPYDGPSEEGTWQEGIYEYWDLTFSYIDRRGYTSYWHEDAKVPWLYNPISHVTISYDNGRSLSEKAQFIKMQHLGGVVFWDFSADKNRELISVLYDEFVIPNSSVSDGDADFPHGFALNVPVPNPFNSSTRISYRLPYSGNVTIKIYDTSGSLIDVLVNERRAAGDHDVIWEPDSKISGLHFVRMEAGDVVIVQKVLQIN